MRMHLSVFVAACVAAATANAQSLEQRVASAHGSVSFDFEVKPNVCGNGSSIMISDDTSPGWTRRPRHNGMTISRNGGGNRDICDQTPAHVVIEHSGSTVSDVRATVGGRNERADNDFGTVSPAEASRYLLAVAPHIAGHGADDALTAAAIADVPLDWRRMLEIAREDDASERARKSSLFWVSQEASEAATKGLSSVAEDDDAQASVRNDALFFLAQRKNGEGIPGLINVVQHSKSPKLRKDAIWYLSQSKDPRALDLFEKILSGR